MSIQENSKPPAKIETPAREEAMHAPAKTEIPPSIRQSDRASIIELPMSSGSK